MLRAATLASLVGFVGACAPRATPQAPQQSSPTSGGLEVSRYAILAAAPEMEAVAAAFAARSWPSPAARAELAAVGLQAAVIRAEDEAAVRQRLGPVSEVVRTALGVTPAWVDLIERPLPAGVGVASEPAWVHVDGDTAAICVRDWAVPDERGGRIEADVAMHLTHKETRRSGAPGDPPDGIVVRGSAFTCSLREGEAMLLLPRPPAPRGRGPALDSELPVPCGALLLGERGPGTTGTTSQAFSVAIVMVPRLPPGITPAPQTAVDTEPPLRQTDAGTSP